MYALVVAILALHTISCESAHKKVSTHHRGVPAEEIVNYGYFATTDTLTEVELLSAADISGKEVHLSAVAGGMSALSLFASLDGRLKSVVFFDHRVRGTDLAALYIELVKMCPTRAEFLQRFFARDAKDGRAVVENITTDNMKTLFYDSPYDEKVFMETATKLALQPFAEKLYLTQVNQGVHLAKAKGNQMGAWPCWKGGLENDENVYGHVYGTPDSKKTGTMYVNQGGFMKTEESYAATRRVVLASKIEFRVVNLNWSNLKSLRSIDHHESQTAAIFVSNALTMPKWVPSGQNKDVMGARFARAFPQGGIVFETASGMGSVKPFWSFKASSTAKAHTKFAEHMKKSHSKFTKDLKELAKGIDKVVGKDSELAKGIDKVVGKDSDLAKAIFKKK